MGAPCPTEDLQKKMTAGDSPNTKPHLKQLLLQPRDCKEKQGAVKKPPSPPDGGWGWVVVFACSVSFFVAGGFGRSFTLIYQELIIKFGQSASSTATVVAIFGAVKLCSSPLVGMLCNKFGLRAVTITGGLVSFVGMLMSSFPPNLPYLCFSYGVVTAFGANMVITPSFVIIGKYFRKRKAKAMSLVTIGACFGGTAFPPLIELLLRRYGYTGAMLPVAAAMLIYCVAGLFYRPLQHDGSSASGRQGSETDGQTCVCRKGSETPENNNCVPAQYSRMNGHGPIYTGQKVPSTCVVLFCQDKPDVTKVTVEDCLVSNNTTTSPDVTKPLSYLQRTSEFCRRLPGAVSRALGLHLLSHGRLAVFVLLMASSFTCLGICNTFLAALAAEAGISRMQVAAILAVSSGVNIPGRFLTGVVFDLKCVRPHRDLLFGIVSILTALVAVLLPLSEDFYIMAGLCVMHFFFGSSMHSQHMTVLSDLVESRQLASAMGLCRFFQGVGVIVGPILGGVFRDQFGSYKYAFFGSGALFLLTAVGYEIYCLVGVKNLFCHREGDEQEDGDQQTDVEAPAT